MPQFKNLGDTGTPFLKVSQATVTALESMTPAEIAQAVPVVKIWRVKPSTGAPFYPSSANAQLPAAPLSSLTAEPPRFGQQAIDGNDIIFRERPGVSFERLEVEQTNPKGVILYRELKLAFVVHRPDVIFGKPATGHDNWSDLLIPGNMFNVRYGWNSNSGVSNPLLNGVGTDEFPAQTDLRMVVTTFSFTFNQNFEMNFEIQAFEDGELQLRQQSMDVSTKNNAQQSNSNAIPLSLGKFGTTTKGKSALAKLQDKFKKQLIAAAKQAGDYPSVAMSEVLDVLFAEPLTTAFTSIGYKTVNLWFGNFNHRAGFTSKYYGAIDQSDRSIGDFVIPMDLIEKTFGRIIKNGKQITVYNFMNVFLNLTLGPKVWDTSNAAKDSHGRKNTKSPQVMLKTVLNPIKGVADVYIVDVIREHTKLIQDESKSPSDNVVQKNPTKQSIRQALEKAEVPYVSFLKGNNYIEQANFHAIIDDKIKNIFIQNGLGPQTSKNQKAKLTDTAAKNDKAIDFRQLLYSSALQGDLTMIGNFAFDTLGLFWLDFGVPRWNGPFFVITTTDVVEKASFVRRITLQSEGDDPLGSQRADAQVNSTL